MKEREIPDFKRCCSLRQLCPVRAERIGRHAEDQHARVLQPFLNLSWYAVARFDFPFVEPDADAVAFEAFGEVADDGFVFGAMAEEDVVLEILAHACGLS